MSDTESMLNQARAFYRTMKVIASVEQTLLDLFSKGLLSGTVHTCLGQEATAAGVVGALDLARDIVFSNHRCHGHYLAYCGDVEGLIAEVMGRATGTCAGIGGSQHLQRDNFYSNGILGGIVPVATGMALAEKSKGSGAIACVFIGDGAMAEGAVYESFNMAALWSLPILFVVEDNGYAQSTPKRLEQAGELRNRGQGWNIPTLCADGRDVMAVHSAAKQATAAIRTGQGPRILYLETYRLAPHSKGDDFRDRAEIEAARARQPLVRLRDHIGEEWCDSCDAEIAAQIAAAVQTCLKAPVASYTELSRGW